MTEQAGSTSCLELLPVEALVVHAEAVVLMVVDELGVLGGVEHHLLGHAADVDARATGAG